MNILFLTYSLCWFHLICGRRSRDRMVVGFITTYAIIAYDHLIPFVTRCTRYSIMW